MDNLLTITTITVAIVQIIVLIWEIITIKKLINSIENLRTEAGVKIREVEKRLEPMINALNKATPFLEVFNAITGIFNNKRGKK